MDYVVVSRRASQSESEYASALTFRDTGDNDAATRKQAEEALTELEDSRPTLVHTVVSVEDFEAATDGSEPAVSPESSSDDFDH